MNERERRFVAEYLVDLNASAAALRAGYGGRRYAWHAHKLVRRPDIAEAIAKAEAERAESRRITADRVLIEYARIAFADMRDFVDWGPNRFELRDRNLLSERHGGAIAKVDPPSNGRPASIRLHDKHAALEMLARHTGLIGPGRIARPTDHRQANRDARAILLERLSRLKKANGAPR
ncbi:MAG TPA: terminase small subunit [Stellaceae bacterium]|nr:terminase small subunit [Stellaceae bacterium]